MKIALKPETHLHTERLNSIVKCIFTIEFRCPRGHHDDSNGESASNSASSLTLFLDYRVPMPARVLAFNSNWHINEHRRLCELRPKALIYTKGPKGILEACCYIIYCHLVRCGSLNFMVKTLSLLDVFTTAALKFGDILHPLNKYDIYGSKGFWGWLKYLKIKFEIRMS